MTLRRRLKELIEGEGWGDDAADDWWREQLRAVLGEAGVDLMEIPVGKEEAVRDAVGARIADWWLAVHGTPLSLGRRDDLAGVALVALGVDPDTLGWNYGVSGPPPARRGEIRPDVEAVRDG